MAQLFDLPAITTLPSGDTMMGWLSQLPRMVLMAFGVVLGVLVLFKTVASFWRDLRKAHLPPYAPGVGIVESIESLAGPDAHTFMYNIFKSLTGSKPWAVRMKLPVFASFFSEDWFMTVVFSSEPDIVLPVMNHPGTMKSLGYKEFDSVCHGQKSIISTEGDEFKNRKKGIVKCFSQAHLDFVEGICQKHLQRWVDDVIEPCAEAGKSFNLSNELIFLTLRIVCEAVLDDTEQMLTMEDLKEFKHHLEIATDEFIFMNLFHTLMPWLFPSVWEAKRSTKFLQDFALRVIHYHRRKHKAYYDSLKDGGSANENATATQTQASSTPAEPNDTIIRRIIENNTYKNDLQRAADVTILLIGSHDTTAYSMGHILMHVARSKPKELEAFRSKIRAMDASASQMKKRSIDEFQWMINEGMRLSPVAAVGIAKWVRKDWMFVRQKDGTMAVVNDEVHEPIKPGSDRVFLPKDSILVTPFLPMMRHPGYFERPDEYLPSRWSGEKKPRLPGLEFSSGPRSCPGKYIAKAEYETVLLRLLSEYDFTIDAPGKLKFSMTLQLDGTRLIPRRLSKKSD